MNCGVITFLSDTLPDGNIGEEYNQTVTVSGAAPPYTLSSGFSLPDGLSFDPESGLISGIPQTPGTALFGVDVFDANFCTGSHLYTLSISCPDLSLAPADLEPASTGTPYSQFLTLLGGEGEYEMWILEGSLPPGMTLDFHTGEVSGTPASAGSFVFSVVAWNLATNCAAVRQYTLTVNCGAIEISPDNLPSGSVGTSYSQAIAANGGTAPYVVAVESGQLPPGLFLSSDGTLSGTPATPGVFAFEMRVDDAGGCSAMHAYSIEIVQSCLLCDEFDDGSLDTRWNYVRPIWNENGGALVGRSNEGKAVALTGNAFPGCLTCSIETSIKFSSKDGSISVLGWYLDRNNYVEVLADGEENRWTMTQRSGGRVVARTRLNKRIQRNTPYTVKVEFDGLGFRVFVDDLTTPLLTLTPGAVVTSGQAGFEVKDTVGRFDYLHIE